MKKTATHPNLNFTITFDSIPHTYTDSRGRVYTSATTFVGQHFEPFDEQAAAAKIAAQTNRLDLDILAEWKSKSIEACRYGSIVHAYAEAKICGGDAPEPEKAGDARAFRIVDTALLMLEKQYKFLEPETIVFDPLYEIAGMMDLPAINRQTGALAILDWKTCESITLDHYGRFALHPISHIPDSKLLHYQLQLSLYAWLITAPGQTAYAATEGEPVELALIHIPHATAGDDPCWRPLEYDPDAIESMINHNQATVIIPREVAAGRSGDVLDH